MAELSVLMNSPPDPETFKNMSAEEQAMLKSGVEEEMQGGAVSAVAAVSCPFPVRASRHRWLPIQPSYLLAMFAYSAPRCHRLVEEPIRLLVQPSVEARRAALQRVAPRQLARGAVRLADGRVV